jgi:methionyl-tRNA formyltransferase
MRTIIITQEDRCYVPLFLSEFLKIRKVDGIVLVPGSLKGLSTVSLAKRLFQVFGLADFTRLVLLLACNCVLNFASSFLRLNRDYSVKANASRYSLPVYREKDINSPAFLKFLEMLNPEVIASVACPQIFTNGLIGTGRHTINIHGSLGLKYRGMMPSFWVLAKGEGKTGVAVHYIDEGVDTGAIIWQKPIDISAGETLHSLQKKVATVGASALSEALEKIEGGDIVRIPPSEEARYFSLPDQKAGREFRKRGNRYF